MDTLPIIATQPPPLLATARLAQFAAGIEGASIPEPVIERMEECLLDFAGVTAHGARLHRASPTLLAGARLLGGGEKTCTVLGEAGRHPQSQAALLNGAFALALGFGDVHGAIGVQAGGPVIAAALGWAEREGASGRELLEAMAIGYEVACRIGAALTTRARERGFDRTAVAGVFGAVAAGARLRRLDAPVLEAAFGVAASLAGGISPVPAGLLERLHGGFAAQAALTALALAEGGLAAQGEPLAGRPGVLAACVEQPHPDVLTQGLGNAWLCRSMVLRTYPAHFAAHAAIEAALALRDVAPQDGLAEAALQLTLAPAACAEVGEATLEKLAPAHQGQAQASAWFLAACAWLDGRIDVRTHERVGSPEIEQLIARMEVLVDPELPPLGCRLALADAPQFAIQVTVPRGDTTRPLERAQLREKFLGLAVPVFGAARSEALAGRLLGMRDEASATDVIQAMRLYL